MFCFFSGVINTLLSNAFVCGRVYITRRLAARSSCCLYLDEVGLGQSRSTSSSAISRVGAKHSSCRLSSNVCDLSCKSFALLTIRFFSSRQTRRVPWESRFRRTTILVVVRSSNFSCSCISGSLDTCVPAGTQNSPTSPNGTFKCWSCAISCGVL